MRKPRFSEISGTRINRVGDIVTVTTTNKNRTTKIPLGVIIVAMTLRTSLAWLSQHHIVSRVVWDSRGRFVCYALYPNLHFQKRSDGYGEEKFLRTVGYQTNRFFDMRKDLYDKLSANDSSIKGWVWSNIPHRGARNLRLRK